MVKARADVAACGGHTGGMNKQCGLDAQRCGEFFKSNLQMIGCPIFYRGEMFFQLSKALEGAFGSQGFVYSSFVKSIVFGEKEGDPFGDIGEVFFRLQIGALLDGGATMIWLEGFQDLDELLLAHEVKQSLHHCPAVCSWHMTENQDHSALVRTMINLQENDVEILGLDGGSAPLLLEALGALKPALGSAFTETPWAVLLSAQTSREELVASAQALAAAGAQILGGGPDTTPEDIAALAEAFSDGSDS